MLVTIGPFLLAPLFVFGVYHLLTWFNIFHVNERAFWKQYTEAYEELLEKTSTDFAPWYVVPSNHGWFRDLLVSQVILKRLEDFDMKYPPLDTSKKDMVNS